ncbi:MAG TPA: DUF6622 family protein [Ramlibacter sp.]|uniref:DUF6622 family protein n=1 Tax=Ramlibacter sp. TaxID=1917967 RepID=UPI002CA73374|nr:DUF6622 family protein [Ramlibacter sp.]HVZ46362.1 DUF6622 family protein [Ramlibacter sp.]
MQLTPTILIHMTAAIGALVIGPVALWARRGRQQRPKLHRAFGYAWVTLMIVTAVSAFFIRDTQFPNVAGFTPIHLLIPVSLFALYRAFRALARGDIRVHRITMQSLYIGACVVAGAFTLLPSRLLGSMLWGSLPSAGFVRQVLSGTPAWVWGLLAALVVVGYLQTRDRTASLARILILPVALGAYSVWGMLGAFGAGMNVILPWLAAVAIVVYGFSRLGAPEGVSYDANTRVFRMSGSWVPMLLILGIFFTRYVVSVDVAIHPELKTHGDFALSIATLYGAMSGIFAGRALRIARMAIGGVPAGFVTLQAR